MMTIVIPFVLSIVLSSSSSRSTAFTNLKFPLRHQPWQKTLPTTVKAPLTNLFIASSRIKQPIVDDYLVGRNNDDGIRLEYYTFRDKKISYQYKEACSGYENKSPLLLIHPIGIGISSWFWYRFVQELSLSRQHPDIYGVNLLGCGIQQNNSLLADEYYHDSDTVSSQFPLLWVEQCETLIKEVIIPRQREASNLNVMNRIRALWELPNTNNVGVTVMVQGGLAPVGVMLAARSISHKRKRQTNMFVSNLILTSPPTYDDMVVPITSQKIRNNYQFFTNRITGRIAFYLLETRAAIEYFSNLFLFQKKCDDVWLDYALQEACEQVRKPIQIFNSGYCNQNSYQNELCHQIIQPVLILQGIDDQIRIPKRLSYQTNMINCTIRTLPSGKNVLPWETPRDVWIAMQQFLRY